MKNAIVIGSGIGGLASAARLAHLGFSVKVFEANASPGGKINSKKMGDFRFDTGPSVLTAPHYIDELYTDVGKKPVFKYKKLKEGFRYFYPDGTRFTLPENPDDQIKVLAKALKENPISISSYLKKAKKNYNLIAPLFIEKSLHNYKGLLGWKLIKALVHINSYALNKTMHEENNSYFANRNTQQFFNRFATYNGSSPYKAPAMLNMISHLEINEGVFLPENGMQQISTDLYNLCKNLGVSFHFNERVDEILTDQSKTTGIRTFKAIYNAQVVVSNMDISFTYEKLLKKTPIPKTILKQEKSSSAVVFYWGIKKSFDELGVHNVFFNHNYKEEFSAIFNEKIIYFDPSIYVNITSKELKQDAPKNCENWFVMVNVPHDTGQDWEQFIPTLRTIIIKKLSQELKVNIEELIEEEDFLSPIKIEQDFLSKKGSIYGNASNNKYAAFYRHSNKHKSIKGLYFAGVSVHPGGGIPLALNAAKIVANYVKRDFKI